MNYGRNDAISMGDEDLRCRELAGDFAARDIACTLDEALLAALIKAARDEVRDEIYDAGHGCVRDECECGCHE